MALITSGLCALQPASRPVPAAKRQALIPPVRPSTGTTPGTHALSTPASTLAVLGLTLLLAGDPCGAAAGGAAPFAGNYISGTSTNANGSNFLLLADSARRMFAAGDPEAELMTFTGVCSH